MGRKGGDDRAGRSGVLIPSGFTPKVVQVPKRPLETDAASGSAATRRTDPSKSSSVTCTICGRNSDSVHQIFDGSRVVAICDACLSSDLDDDEST
jgi:hypothetical protein